MWKVLLMCFTVGDNTVRVSVVALGRMLRWLRSLRKSSAMYSPPVPAPAPVPVLYVALIFNQLIFGHGGGLRPGLAAACRRADSIEGSGSRRTSCYRCSPSATRVLVHRRDVRRAAVRRPCASTSKSFTSTSKAQRGESTGGGRSGVFPPAACQRGQPVVAS